MARKPNYRFARLERERNKAARKAERAKLKAERAEQRRREKAGQLAEVEIADGVEANGLDGASDESPAASAQDGKVA